jgi:hypothetical protein
MFLSKLELIHFIENRVNFKDFLEKDWNLNITFNETVFISLKFEKVSYNNFSASKFLK